MGVTVILPSSGINHLWQLHALLEVQEQLNEPITSVYGCSGGMWAAMFFSMGAAQDWLDAAPEYYARWSRTNKYRFSHKLGHALREDSFEVLRDFGFFEKFAPQFRLYARMFEVYPERAVHVVRCDHLDAKETFEIAIASSTVPMVTGTVAMREGKYMVDGGAKPVWRLEDLEVEDRKNKIIIIDAYSREHIAGAKHVWPQQPLRWGLHLLMPREFPKKHFEDIIHTPAQADVSGR